VLTGSDWRGRPINPANLLKKYNLTITPGVNVSGGKVWKIVALWETHGRPELRMVVEGTDDPVAFFAKTTAGLELANLRTEMKDDAGVQRNLLNLNVQNAAYYEPKKMAGPYTLSVQNVPSDFISGLGLAVDPDPQYGSNPQMEDDNRYLTVVVVWQLGDGGSAPPVTPPVEPPVPPQPPTGPSGPDLAALQFFVKQEVTRQVAAVVDRLRASL
jgi:hypothetical protein